MRMQVQSKASLGGLGMGVVVSCGVGHRSGSDPTLLWHRLAAIAPIRLLACEFPYAMSAALKKKKERKKKKHKIVDICVQISIHIYL